MTNIALSPTGKRVVVEARGEIFTIPAEKGDVRNLTNSSGSAERDPAWSPDGKYVSYFSDKSGEYKLVIEEQDGLTPPREIALPKPTHYYTPSWSPDSKKLLYTDTNLKVWVLDVESGKAKVVGSDPWMVPQRTLNPVWSPDSKWVAYASRLHSLYRAIFVSNVETGETKQVTDGLADAMWPAWDASGKYLWFLASTDFGLRSQWLDMTSYDRDGELRAVPRGAEEGRAEPAAARERRGRRHRSRAARRRAAAAPAARAAPADAPAERRRPAAARAPRARATPVAVQIDFDGLQQRIISVPGVPERQYTRAEGRRRRHGVLPRAACRRRPRGRRRRDAAALSPERPPGGAVRHRRRRVRRQRRRPASCSIARAAEAAARGRGGARRRPPARASSSSTPIATRRRRARAPRPSSLRMYLEPKEEFQQIFNEGWRNQRDYLYVPNMHGSRLAEDEGRCTAQLLPYVNHRADLNYLLDNMGAEIAIGHSYVRGGDMPEVPPSPGGLLGADFAIESGRYRITRIYDNESWNPDLRAPLAAPGVDVAVGDYILAINGVELRAPDNIYRLLDGTANRQTVLTVNSKPVAGRRAAGDGRAGRERAGAAHARVGRVRTAAWSTSCRTASSPTSTCRTPASPATRASTATTSRSRTRRARSSTSATTAAARRPTTSSTSCSATSTATSTTSPAIAMPFTSPAAGIWGPKVMIINEMAGSGGDLMPYMFKLPQDRPARRQADVGRPRAHGRHAAVHRRRLDDRAARRLLHARRQVGGRERRRRRRTSTSRTGRRTSSPAAIRSSSARSRRRCGC